MIRLGILGCGAITEIHHLPVVLQEPQARLVALVDLNRNRVRALRDFYRLDCKIAGDYHEILGEVDAVINALPNHLHAPVNLELLQAGIPVLCEKPLATKVAAARACCEEAQRTNVPLALSMPMRYFAKTEIVDLVLKDGLLGLPLQYDWEHGMPYDWATTSGFYFSREKAGGGVTLDEGIHCIDLLMHWFGPVTAVDYSDDDWGGGIEANAVLQLSHNGPWGKVSGRLRLSRTYALTNRLSIWGKDKSLEAMRSCADSVAISSKLAGREVRDQVYLPEGRPTTTRQAFQAQLGDFVKVVQTGCRPAVDGISGLHALEVIEQCYACDRRLAEPWLDETCLREKLEA